MRIVEIMIKRENEGTIREGFSGASQVLMYNNKGVPEIKFFSYKGKLKFKIPVKEGVTYIVGPSWVKEVIPHSEDTYFPRRWGRLNKKPHTSYFKKMKPGDVYTTPGLFEIGKGVKLECPESVQMYSIKPLGDFGYSICLLNIKWLESVKEYEVFEEEMKRPHKHCGA